MKKNYYLLLALTSLIFISCSGENDKYQPIQGYKGMIKRIVSYSYESDFHKSKIISKYGAPIPAYIREYNKYGNATMSVGIDLPDDDDQQVCIVYIDSIAYNKKQELDSIVSYVIYTNTNEVMYYNEPQKLINSNTTFVEKTIEKCHYTKKGSSESQIKTSTLFYETKKLDNISNVIQDFYKNRFGYFGESFLNHIPKTDTTSIVLIDYDNDKIIREKHQNKEITYYYDKDLLSSKTIITENDTTTIKYNYKDGHLWEVKSDDTIERYDNQGRTIYYKTDNREEINTYKGDTIKISSKSTDYGNFVYFSKENQDSLDVFSISINLADEKLYTDDVIMLLEKFAKNEISQEKLMNEIESIIYKIDDSEFNTFTSTVYSNYDTHNNPLNTEESTIYMNNNYAAFSSPSLSKYKYYLDKKVTKRERKDITEKEIEYYSE